MDWFLYDNGLRHYRSSIKGGATHFVCNIQNSKESNDAVISFKYFTEPLLDLSVN